MPTGHNRVAAPRTTSYGDNNDCSNTRGRPERRQDPRHCGPHPQLLQRPDRPHRECCCALAVEEGRPEERTGHRRYRHRPPLHDRDRHRDRGRRRRRGRTACPVWRPRPRRARARQRRHRYLQLGFTPCEVPRIRPGHFLVKWRAPGSAPDSRRTPRTPRAARGRRDLCSSASCWSAPRTASTGQSPPHHR